MIKYYKLIDWCEYDENALSAFELKSFGLRKDYIESELQKANKMFQRACCICVYIAPNAEIWKALCVHYKIPEWACAATFDTTVFVKPESMWSNFNVGTIEETILHEAIHCLTNDGGQMVLPIWLSEALAIHFSNQEKYYKQLSIDGIDFEVLGYEHKDVYDLSISKLRFMLENQSIESILEPFKRGGETYEFEN